jgi:hypothetical protein
MIDDNLASVLSNVAADARPATRIRIADSAETRAFLEIGLLLLRDDLLDHRGPDMLAEHDSGTRLFAGLSQARLIERSEQQDQQQDHPRMLTVGMFRDRWRYKSRYTEDLIAYLMRPALLEQTMFAVRQAMRDLPADIPLPELIRMMADATLASTLEDPNWSLQTIVWVALPNHPRVREFLKSRYEYWISQWASLYEEVGRRYGVTMRPGHTWLDLAYLLNTVADGARVRAAALGSVANLTSGDNVLVASIHAMLPTLLVEAPSMDHGG